MTTVPRFNLDDYIDVQTRINRFWEEYPEGSILTDIGAITQDHKSVVCIATVRKQRDGAVDATGIAQETAGGSGANLGSWVENCETSAIGRALANMGYATSSADRMSREEAAKANRVEERAAAAPAAAAANGNGRTAAPARRQTATVLLDGEALSEGQSKNLYRLMKKLETSVGMTKDAFKDELERLGYPRDDRQLSKDQASRAITHFKLMAEEEVADDDPRPEEIPF